jgi:hypothetical protein
MTPKTPPFAGRPWNRRNALLAGRDEGGRNLGPLCQPDRKLQNEWHRTYAYLRDLFNRRANGHLANDIDALMPWAYVQRTSGA